MTTDEKPTGIAAAAVAAAAIGLVVLAVSHLVAEASPAGKAWVHGWGKAWMPGAQGLGPYSGKETLALLAWLGSWGLLHRLWRRRAVSLLAAGWWSLIGIGWATTLLWPPVTHVVVRLVTG